MVCQLALCLCVLSSIFEVFLRLIQPFYFLIYSLKIRIHLSQTCDIGIKRLKFGKVKSQNVLIIFLSLFLRFFILAPFVSIHSVYELQENRQFFVAVKCMDVCNCRILVLSINFYNIESVKWNGWFEVTSSAADMLNILYSILIFQ